jgi:hypothetical protein
MDPNNDLTHEYVRELFDYDYATGNLLWRVRKSPRNPVGSVAGHLHGTGYVKVRIDYKNYSAHRIVWLWHHGVWPTYMIDHINGDRADNRIENLRDVSQSINCRNTERQREGDNCIREMVNGWAAHIYLPQVATQEEAIDLRRRSIAVLQAHGLYPQH